MATVGKTLGFLSLVSIVIGSQLGSGAFVLPSQLAPFKTIGLLGWVVSVAGAISLALVFSDLSSHLPKSGGPHVYVSAAFGRVAAFFTAWLYWVVSWASNSILLVTIIYYLSVITGTLSGEYVFAVECLVLLFVVWTNLQGVKFSGKIETFLTVLKVLPLIVLPFVFFCFFDPSHFQVSIEDVSDGGAVLTTVSQTALLTFWGFIGVECATTPAGCVRRPEKNIPRAIILGTTCVALVYLLNTVSITGVVGFDKLAATNAPYAAALEHIFSHYSNVAISVMAIIVCVGTLNAWTLTSGQIAYGACEEGLFPKIFGKTNSSGAPVAAILIAAIGSIPFLALEQFNTGGLGKLIDLLVSIFLFVYLACCISYVKLLHKWHSSRWSRIKASILAQFAVVFCIFALSQDMISSLLVLGILLAVGFPIFWRRRAYIPSLLSHKNG